MRRSWRTLAESAFRLSAHDPGPSLRTELGLQGEPELLLVVMRSVCGDGLGARWEAWSIPDRRARRPGVKYLPVRFALKWPQVVPKRHFTASWGFGSQMAEPGVQGLRASPTPSVGRV